MTKATFDTVIHAPNRLQICALLDTTKELEFQIIKEQLDVSDSVLCIKVTMFVTQHLLKC